MTETLLASLGVVVVGFIAYFQYRAMERHAASTRHSNDARPESNSTNDVHAELTEADAAFDAATSALLLRHQMLDKLIESRRLLNALQTRPVAPQLSETVKTLESLDALLRASLNEERAGDKTATTLEHALERLKKFGFVR